MLSDEGFYNVSDKRRKRQKLSVILLILVLVNIGVLAFFVVDFRLTVDALQCDFETLQDQLNSANYEITRLHEQMNQLQEQMKLLNAGNASESLTLVQLYNSTWRSLI